MSATVDAIADTIRAHRFAYVDEDELQEGLAAALTAAGFAVKREVRLDARSSIDLLVDRVGVEVKVGGTAGALEQQIERYAASDRLDALVAVTSRVRHLCLPPIIGGKPVETVAVGAL